MKIEDKRQQEKLISFDRVLRESTGQITWFVSGIFTVVTLMMGLLIIYDVGEDRKDTVWMLLCYVCVAVWMITFVLSPYCWSTENFSQRNQNTDAVNEILRYVPLARKNYVRVRMQHLWRFVWKFAAVAIAIVLVIMGVQRVFTIDTIVEALLLFVAGPMLFGYLPVRLQRFHN